MLVLSRTEREEIVVQLPDGRALVILVIDIRHGHKVRLGFTGDEDIKVHRREVWDHIKEHGPKPAAIRDPLGVAEAYEEAAAEGVVQ